MGVPLFFKFLIQKYPEIIKKYKKDILNTNELFFDFNGLIHPACSKARKEFSECTLNKTDDMLYSKMLKNIKQQTELIIDLINPSDYVLLAVDGVAPLAKINQQRSRRYKSNLLNNKINYIKSKYDIAQDNWDTNAISPGTPFMNNLMKDLDVYTKNNFKDSKFNIDLSDSNNCGEGEHKILAHIKTTNNNNINKVIYGLDA
jgi:5'-3' exonuclease